MANLETLLEAERRGILPEEKAAILAEARKRGLIQGNASAPEDSAKTDSKPSLKMQAADKFLESLPVGGATFGSGLGTPFGLYGRTGGAAAGGYIGKSVENIARSITGIGGAPNAKEALIGPFLEGAEQGAWEAGGGRLGEIATSAFSKLRPKAVEFAEKAGLKLSPTTLNPGSRWAQFKEWVGNAVPTGRMYTKYQQDKTYRWMMDSRAKFLEEATGVPLGEGSFTRTASEAATAARTEGSKAYADIIVAAGGPDKTISVPGLKSWFDEVYETAPQKLQQLIRDFRTRTGGGEAMTAKDLDEFVAKLAKVKEFKTNIEPILFDDLEPVVRDAVASAAGKFKQSKNYEFMNGLFTKFTTERNGEEFFQTGNFYRTVMNPKTQKYIKDNFGGVVLQNMNDYAEMMLTLGREAEKKFKGNEVAELAKIAMLGGGSYLNPAVATAFAFGPVAAWMVMKPRKEFLRWMATSPAAKQALMIGGRAAISNNKGVTGDW